jgi:hypothetical protein
LKYGEIGSAIVIGDDNLRVERSDRISSLIGWHGVAQIHAHERHVDVLECTHLGDAFGVAGEVEALAAVREDVAIAASLVVKESFPGVGPRFRLYAGTASMVQSRQVLVSPLAMGLALVMVWITADDARMSVSDLLISLIESLIFHSVKNDAACLSNSFG